MNSLQDSSVRVECVQWMILEEIRTFECSHLLCKDSVSNENLSEGLHSHSTSRMHAMDLKESSV